MALVITYAYAYLRGTVDLCAQHAAEPPESLPALGAVQHGEHTGRCDACRAEAFAEQGFASSERRRDADVRAEDARTERPAEEYPEHDPADDEDPGPEGRAC